MLSCFLAGRVTVRQAQGLLFYRRVTVVPPRLVVETAWSTVRLYPQQQRRQHQQLQNNNNNNNNNKMNDDTTTTKNNTADIEDLHRLAVLQGSTTYVDPTTGFTCFTELAHLQRGQCCGNRCRHCPYGWIHVVRTGERRPAVVTATATSEGVAARLQELQQAQREYHQLLQQQQQQQQEQISRASYPNGTISPATTTTKKTGGRHGGRLTRKNVPYTRGGDTGTSSLLTGERRSKTDDAFEAMGTIDELCSFVGVAHAEWEREIIRMQSSNQRQHDDDETEDASGTNGQKRAIQLQEWLLDIMSRLFDIGSHVAKPRRKPVKSDNVSSDNDDDDDDSPVIEFVADGIGGGFDVVHVHELEDWIDQLTDDLPELRSFILPTGSLTAAQLHVCRCVCRRAERRVIPLVQEQGVCDPTALQYLNRLSDFFFSAARWVNLNSSSSSSSLVGVAENGRQREEIQYRRPTRSSKQRDRVSVPLGEKK